MLAVTSFSFEEMVYFCLKGINSFVVKKTLNCQYISRQFYFTALGLKTKLFRMIYILMSKLNPVNLALCYNLGGICPLL